VKREKTKKQKVQNPKVGWPQGCASLSLLSHHVAQEQHRWGKKRGNFRKKERKIKGKSHEGWEGERIRRRKKSLLKKGDRLRRACFQAGNLRGGITQGETVQRRGPVPRLRRTLSPVRDGKYEGGKTATRVKFRENAKVQGPMRRGKNPMAPCLVARGP